MKSDRHASPNSAGPVRISSIQPRLPCGPGSKRNKSTIKDSLRAPRRGGSPPHRLHRGELCRGLPGHDSLRPETVTAVIVDIAGALARMGVRDLVLANSHFDPTHLGSIYAAIEQIRTAAEIAVIFPDVTRKPWASRLTDEFKSGACHAGRYEGSIVLARRPDLVREAVSKSLVANPASLSVAIREGKKSFEEAGGPDAYFGDPAAATAEEGEATIAVLGGILEEAVWGGVGKY
ncbi:MAG: creatininase family protein [Thermoanaerobaculia bacterium]|nr:creatininase family protein [Thermoanaerobaculia bacterium]